MHRLPAPIHRRAAGLLCLTFGLLGLGSGQAAQAKVDPKVEGFVTSFIASVEKSTGVKVPKSEATCVGTKFLAKVKVGDLLKSAVSNDLTKPQKVALTQAFGGCLSGATYKAILSKNLASQFSAGQLTCIGDKAVAQLGVPALIDLDFQAYTGSTGTPSTAKTQAALGKIALSCANK